MNTICKTCGTTLQSDISREYGRCGACRSAWENAEDHDSGREPGDHGVPPPRQGDETTKPR